jgi:hypothetical protein
MVAARGWWELGTLFRWLEWGNPVRTHHIVHVMHVHEFSKLYCKSGDSMFQAKCYSKNNSIADVPHTILFSKLSRSHLTSKFPIQKRLVPQGHLVTLELKGQKINLQYHVTSALPVLTVPYLPKVATAQLTEKLYLWTINLPLVSEVRGQVPNLRSGFWAWSR